MKKRKWFVNLAHSVNWGSLALQVLGAVGSGQKIGWQTGALWLAQAAAGAALPSVGGLGHKLVFKTDQEPASH